MADTLAQALIVYLEESGYPDPTDEKQRVQIILGLDNGVVLRGTIVSPQRFMEENGRSKGGTWPDPDPERFPVPLRHDPPTSYIHLVNVNYLSGGTWTEGSTARVGIDKVAFAGEKF